MKKLILVRHAKSSWDYSVADHHRPLAENGIERAKLHAKLLLQNLDYNPEYWVSSFACRALHTATIFAENFESLDQLRIKKELYTFSGNSLLSAIKNFPNSLDSAIVFGHNEACREVVEWLSGQYIYEFKTASVAVLNFQASKWTDLAHGEMQFMLSSGKKIK